MDLFLTLGFQVSGNGPVLDTVGFQVSQNGPVFLTLGF